MDHYPDRLDKIGTLGVMKESAWMIRHNFSLFFSFVTSFTIPYSVFTVFLASAIDIHHHYTVDDFIAQKQIEFHGWKFTPLTAVGAHFLFVILQLLPMGWLNTVTCIRGVTNVYARVDLTTGIKNSYEKLQWGVLRLVATQVWFYLFMCAALLTSSLLSSIGEPSSSIIWNSIIHVVGYLLNPLVLVFFLYLYLLPVQQVAVLEPTNYGIEGWRRAARLVREKRIISFVLALCNLIYFALVKIIVDLTLKDSYPFWTKFLVYPPLVIFVITMSVFWQVTYTVFYLACKMHHEGSESIISPLALKEDPAAAEEITQALLANVEGNQDGEP